MVVGGTLIDMVAEAELPDVSVTQDGLNVIFQPKGAEALKLTEPLNPPRDVTVAVRLADEVGFTFMVEAEVVMEKSFAGVGTG